jgi:hypothetical protein
LWRVLLVEAVAAGFSSDTASVADAAGWEASEAAGVSVEATGAAEFPPQPIDVRQAAKANATGNISVRILRNVVLKNIYPSTRMELTCRLELLSVYGNGPQYRVAAAGCQQKSPFRL